ncbi:MAG: hypothetical protein HKN25_09975 [Pyrinomonadaceae bacterium]|nr:hypothetical protein [Pyrinomonadaceae bacterium]
MNGRSLLINTLRVNAVFSMLSGLDLILFDKTIAQILSGNDIGSFFPIGMMLIGFSVFVFVVSTLSAVNKYLVSAIIAMDILWVVGSIFIIAFGFATFTTIGIVLIGAVAAIIALFAYLQTKGLRIHLKKESAGAN